MAASARWHPSSCKQVAPVSLEEQLFFLPPAAAVLRCFLKVNEKSTVHAGIGVEVRHLIGVADASGSWSKQTFPSASLNLAALNVFARLSAERKGTCQQPPRGHRSQITLDRWLMDTRSRCSLRSHVHLSFNTGTSVSRIKIFGSSFIHPAQTSSCATSILDVCYLCEGALASYVILERDKKKRKKS